MPYLPSWVFTTGGLIIALFAFDSLRDLLVKIEKNTRKDR